MSSMTQEPYSWTTSATTDIVKNNRLSYTPLPRLLNDHDEKTIVEPEITNQVQRMLLIDDDEIYSDEEEEEDFTNLPPTKDLTQIQHDSSDDNSLDFKHIQYINSIRKTRPLPQIPQRSTSKELPKNMTEVFNDSFKSQNKLTAQQLFKIMCDNRANAALNSSSSSSDEEEEYNSTNKEEDSDDSDDYDYYDGVYALKTQVPSPEISKRNSLIHSSYHYDHFNTHAYKMMTPVEEVEEEDQLYADYELEVEQQDEEEEITTTNFLMEPGTTLLREGSTSSSLSPRSEISLSTPSLASGCTSPSCHSIEKEGGNDAAYYDGEQRGEEECQTEDFQPQQFNNINTAIEGVNSLYDNDNYIKENNISKEGEEPSLVSDVQRLSQLNQALMTPVLCHKEINAAVDQQQTVSPIAPQQPSLSTESNNEYKNINTSSPQAMTSFSLTHDKENIKTYRRMATKTHDKNIQFTYAKYLLQLVSFYNSSSSTIISKSNTKTRDRLQEEAEYWIEKLAKGGHAEALYIKGQWHRHCFGNTAVFVGSQYKKVNHNKAVKCFQHAAKLGFAEAHYELAEYYKFRKEYKKAMSSYRYAASKNHILSLYKLANILLRGLLNQEKDARQGMIFLKKAADTNKPESARSAYDLACIYSNDFESIELDSDTMEIIPDLSSQTHELAVQYYKKADELDLTIASFRLGYIYEHGHLGTEVNPWEAFKYYSKAAERNYEGAMLKVSRFYENGIPGYINPHPGMAHEWCMKATENGNEVAEYMVGVHYELGIGVHSDYAQAAEWFSKSASKGYRPAQEKLNIPSNKRMSMINTGIENQLNKYVSTSNNKKRYYDESVCIAEKSRRTHAEQNCQIM